MTNQEIGLDTFSYRILKKRLVEIMKNSVMEQRRNEEKLNPTIVEWIKDEYC